MDDAIGLRSAGELVAGLKAKEFSSRELLDVPGESSYPILPLPLPRAGVLDAVNGDAALVAQGMETAGAWQPCSPRIRERG